MAATNCLGYIRYSHCFRTSSSDWEQFFLKVPTERDRFPNIWQFPFPKHCVCQTHLRKFHMPWCLKFSQWCSEFLSYYITSNIVSAFPPFSVITFSSFSSILPFSTSISHTIMQFLHTHSSFPLCILEHMTTLYMQTRAVFASCRLVQLQTEREHRTKFLATVHHSFTPVFLNHKTLASVRPSSYKKRNLQGCSLAKVANHCFTCLRIEILLQQCCAGFPHAWQDVIIIYMEMFSLSISQYNWKSHLIYNVFYFDS